MSSLRSCLGNSGLDQILLPFHGIGDSHRQVACLSAGRTKSLPAMQWLHCPSLLPVSVTHKMGIAIRFIPLAATCGTAFGAAQSTAKHVRCIGCALLHTLHWPPLRGACSLVAASGSGPSSCMHRGDSGWLLWTRPLSCSAAVVGPLLLGTIGRLLITVWGFKVALPPRGLGCLKFLNIPSLLS